ncbi:MAG: hypothetical protein FWG87_02420 [Defluviitaleaceae bacterium]|nr:hypothetical protein [Defluviitaleaceae bacterium]
MTRGKIHENPRKYAKPEKIRVNLRKSVKSVFDLHVLVLCGCRDGYL